MKKTKLLVITSLVVALLLNYVFIIGAYATDQEFALREIGDIPTDGRTDVVHTVRDTVYILDFVEGFLIYDVSDPTNPTLLGSYECHNYIDPIVRGGHSFVIRGNNAFVGFQHGGLKIIDVSNQHNIQVEVVSVSSFVTSFNLFYFLF